MPADLLPKFCKQHLLVPFVNVSLAFLRLVYVEIAFDSPSSQENGGKRGGYSRQHVSVVRKWLQMGDLQLIVHMAFFLRNSPYVVVPLV